MSHTFFDIDDDQQHTLFSKKAPQDKNEQMPDGEQNLEFSVFSSFL
jgi:hypothetical protein